MSKLVILKWRPFEFKMKFEKRPLFYVRNRTKKILKIYKSTAVENFKPLPLCPIKRRPAKVFVKLYKSRILIANIVKGAVSGLRQFLATESH